MAPSAEIVDELRDLAARTARTVGAYVLSEADAGHGADQKSSRTDLVTAIDRESETRIVAAIAGERPHDAFMGEEGTDRPGTSGIRWIIDPIDGTANFVLGHPGFAVSIAAELEGTVIAGAVMDPAHDQLFAAGAGRGATCNGRPIGTRPTIDLELSVLATGFSFDPARRRLQAESLATILPEIADIRRMGSAATDLCSVGLGRVDGYWELGLNPWDHAAGALVAREAGAVVQVVPPGSDAARQPSLVVAAAPGIADALHDLLRRAGVS